VKVYEDSRWNRAYKCDIDCLERHTNYELHADGAGKCTDTSGNVDQALRFDQSHNGLYSFTDCANRCSDVSWCSAFELDVSGATPICYIINDPSVVEVDTS
jgi:hypothetical protein